MIDWKQMEMELNSLGLTAVDDTPTEIAVAEQPQKPKFKLSKEEWIQRENALAIEQKQKYGLPTIGSDKQKTWICRILGKFCEMNNLDSINDNHFFSVNLKTLVASAIIAHRDSLEQGKIPHEWLSMKGPSKDELKKGMKRLTPDQRSGKTKIVDSRKPKKKKTKPEQQPSMLDHFGIKLPDIGSDEFITSLTDRINKHKKEQT